MSSLETGRAYRRALASADHAGWSIREAAWSLEERVLWRGSDAAQAALDRAGRATEPLQRLIQTRLAWPLSDAYRARGRKTRAALAASAATLVVAAGAAGAITADDRRAPPRASWRRGPPVRSLRTTTARPPIGWPRRLPRSRRPRRPRTVWCSRASH